MSDYTFQVRLPHKPGKLTQAYVDSKVEEADQARTNPEQAVNAYVTGQDNQTGQVYVSHPGSTRAIAANQVASPDTPVYPGQKAQVTRATTGGQRTVQADVQQQSAPNTLEFTVSSTGVAGQTQKNTSPSPSSTQQASSSCPPPPPPPPDPPPGDPSKGGANPGTPTPDPSQPGNPGSSSSYGASSIGLPAGGTDDPCAGGNPSCDWYSGQTCPSGTVSKGFVEYPKGTFKSLCCGSAKPPGEGCGWQNPPMGWGCDGNQCVYMPYGSYASKEECQKTSCETPSTWKCINHVCTEVKDGSGSFSSLAACQQSGCENPPSGYYHVKWLTSWTVKRVDTGVSTSFTNVPTEINCPGIRDYTVVNELSTTPGSGACGLDYYDSFGFHYHSQVSVGSAEILTACNVNIVTEEHC